jgi:hypothetical protein
MHTTRSRSLVRASILATVSVVAGSALYARQDGGETETWNELHRDYGFSGIINSKVNEGLSDLTVADVDDDGRKDIVTVNNGRSKIEFLIQRAPGDAGASDPKLESTGNVTNELPDEAFFKRDSYATEEQVSAIAIGDVDGDGKAELLYCGDSGKLSVVSKDDKGAFTRAVRFDVENLSASGRAITVVDVDADGKNDVVVLGKETTYFFKQTDKGRLEEALKLPNAQKDPGALYVCELDGDGRVDLVYVVPGTEWPFRWRFGKGAFAFGPELTSRFAEVRAWEVSDLNGDKKADVAAIRRRSGRVATLRLATKTVEGEQGFKLSSVRVVPFEPMKDADKRADVLADVNGDGRPELVVAEPSAARIVVYSDVLAGQRFAAYPSMNGVTTPRVGDVDGDGKVDLMVAAQAEEAIGQCAIGADGKIAFPTGLAIPGGQTLLSLEVVDQDGDGKAETWAMLADGKGSKRKVSVARLDAKGTPNLTVEVADVKSDPTDLLVADINRDGKNDLMLFVKGELPRIFGCNADGQGFTDFGTKELPGIGILKGVPKAALAYGDVDGDGQNELLVPGPNFARSLYFGADKLPKVVAQYNLDSPAAELTSAGFADLDGDKKAEIVVVDKRAAELVVLSQVDGAAKERLRVDLGELAGASVRFADLDANGSNDVLLVAKDRFGMIQNGGSDAVLETIADFDLPIKDGYPFELTLGDVNGNGETDAVFIESAHHLIAIAAVRANRIEYALKFPVFEERIFDRGDGGGRPEPREIALGDVTGDGKNDIAILVHDRVLVYPQE